MKPAIALLLALAACGGSWSSSDAASTSNAMRQELMIERECAMDMPDGGCSPSRVRALDRAAFCASASVLYGHGVDTPDAGIACAPPQ